MDLEFLIRRTPKWRVALQGVLFTEGDITAAGEKAEKAEDEVWRLVDVKRGGSVVS